VATTAEHPPESPGPGGAAQLTARQLRAWRGLLRVHATMTKALDAQLEAEHGMTLSSYEVLMYLNDAEGRRMRMSELASTVILSRSGLTRLVDRMEHEGLLRRERCEDDARGFNAAITPKGRELFQRARRTHLDGVRERFLSHLSAGELGTLGDLWEKVAPGAAS
jgi:DNA-binding MarR family transcriptional regulator